jgi:hypothetical protein
MSDIPQLVAAIDSRLTDIAAEIVALEAAKAQLGAPRTGGQTRATTTASTPTRARRRPARRRVTPSDKHPEPAIRSREPEPIKASQDVGRAVAPKRSARKRAPTRPRRGRGAVGPETVERLLADTPAGLSARAIAEQVGAGYNHTLMLLRELEAAGQVRRSGSRRSTAWRLITEEEHIAQRAAELERRMSAPSQRRGRARAS